MKLFTLMLSALTLFITTSVSAANIQVDMLNKLGKERMVFEPKVVHVKAGDTVTWKAIDKSHNVAFIKGGVPEGVELFKSKINKDAEYTFSKPGVYAYKCTPHFGMGMIGFVVVDEDLSNLDKVKTVKYPGKSKKLAKKLIDEISSEKK